MKTFLSVVLLFSLMSCSRDRRTVYEYNQSTITRIDKDGETFFYYGDFRNTDTFPTDYILATYSGFNYVMASYLIFNKDKTVTFIDLGDGLKKVGNSTSLHILERQDNSHFVDWSDGIKGKFDSIIRIDDALTLERELNTKNHSKVVATYLPAD